MFGFAFPANCQKAYTSEEYLFRLAPTHEESVCQYVCAIFGVKHILYSPYSTVPIARPD